MKVGDAVKFIGFEGYRLRFEGYTEKDSSLPSIGIIVEIHEVYGKRRYDVAWPNGSFGMWLYAETLEVVSEAR